MIKYNTNNPIGSPSVKDIHDNSINFDNAVNDRSSEVWIDRFGQNRKSWYGIEKESEKALTEFRQESKAAILAAGYVPIDSFQDGATLTIQNQVLRWKQPDGDGEYYRWDGDLPKLVPENSTPETTGGIGKGAWISVGYASVKDELEKGQYRTNATSIYYVPNIAIDTITDNRNAIYAYGKDVYIPDGLTIRCNLLPADDITIFKGEGKILTKDKWGNEHVFDVKKANEGSDFTVRNRIHQSCKSDITNHVSIGIIGDSITDGAYGKPDWTNNPVGGAPERNLVSTDYNHSKGGGSMSWFAHFGYLMDEVLRRFSSSRCRYYNAACAGKQLADGWAYRNFDYGFFQNKAYANKAPDIYLLSMGWNDITENNFDVYMKEFDKVIRKAWGYGCVVGLVTVNTNDANRTAQESAVKRGLAERYKNVEYFDLSQDLRKFVDTDVRFQSEVYINQEGTLDVTHPQALGHVVMAGSMLKQVFKDSFVPTLNVGQSLGLVNADKYWYISGVTTKKGYSVRKVKLDRSEQLKEIGVLAKADIESEDVNLTTYIWCDDDDSELMLVETRATDFTTEARNHNITVKSPAGLETGVSYQTLAQNISIASSALGDGRVLSTDVCKLRYGLNRIVIRYSGKPNQVYIPILMVNKRSTLGARFDMKRVTRRGTQSAPLFKMGTIFANTVTSNLYDGSSFAKLPDWYAQVSSGEAVVTVHGGIPQDGAAIITNYNEFEKSGVAIKRVGGVIHFGALMGDVVESWTQTVLDATKDFSVFIYQANGTSAKGTSIRIVDESGAEYSSAFDRISGGSLGSFTADDTEQVTFTVSFAAYKVA
ncbi:SGNH/GDSL hydrolase family protein [Providencia stuartii]|uniref:tail fiber/spike domain-containing protein n=1 Tax=Providencia stuartii TaxID=588 RepID=UPI0034E42CD7